MKIIPIFLLAILAILPFCNTSAQSTKKPATTTIQVLQFHLEHRCISCRKIEKFTREVVATYPALSFSLINVDDKKNEAIAKQFQASGTALFLYNPKTGKKKELTDFAFMTVGDQAKFEQGLKQQIDVFLKS